MVVPQRYFFFFCESAESAADLLAEPERPSLRVFDAFVAAGEDVFLVFLVSVWASAEPAADLLLEAVEALLSVLEAALAAFVDVVFPGICSSA